MRPLHKSLGMRLVPAQFRLLAYNILTKWHKHVTYCRWWKLTGPGLKMRTMCILYSCPSVGILHCMYTCSRHTFWVSSLSHSTYLSRMTLQLNRLDKYCRSCKYSFLNDIPWLKASCTIWAVHCDINVWYIRVGHRMSHKMGYCSSGAWIWMTYLFDSRCCCSSALILSSLSRNLFLSISIASFSASLAFHNIECIWSSIFVCR